jgi:hypothetical protein
MAENDTYNPIFSDRDEEIKKLFADLKEENQRLRLENDHLKKELEREQILHRNLYKEWKELKSGESSEPRKVKRLVRKKLSKSSYYGILAITILLFAFIFYFAFATGTSKASSSQVPPANLADTTAMDTTSKNSIQKVVHKSAMAKPAIKSPHKRNAMYSLKREDNSFVKEETSNDKSISFQKPRSTRAGN